MRNKHVFLGRKIRWHRQRLGWTQAELAKRLDISASYLNLLEHDKRSVTVPVLLRLGQVLGVDVEDFADSDDHKLVDELSEALADAVFDHLDLTPADVKELANQAPAGARALLSLYRAYRSAREDAQALGAQVSAGEERGLLEHYSLPSEEVSDMIQRHGNHFPELETAAENLWEEARLQAGDLRRGLVEHLARRHDVRVEVVPARDMAGAVRLFDPRRGRLAISEMLPLSSRVFQLAHQVGLLELERPIERILADSTLTTEDSRALARVALANYFAGAVMMPYEPFLEAARSSRYDIELLEHRFLAGFEQVCHRLTTLHRPGAAGVPFHMVRIDIAGNISKRFSGSGIRFARYGGSCPRWNVHAAFMSPGHIRTQLSKMPDGTMYFCIARTVRKGGGGYRVPQTRLAIGLGCRVEFARELVYADGVDVNNHEAAVPIGVSCRLCERMDCHQRAFPPMKHKLNVDVNRRGLSFYHWPERLAAGG